MWQAWLIEQWNQPTLNDYYQMQVAAEVRRVLSKKPNQIKLNHFQLKFGKEDNTDLPDPEETNLVKATWGARIGKQLGRIYDAVTDKLVPDPKKDK